MSNAKKEEAREILQDAARELETIVDSESTAAGYYLGGIYALLDNKEDAIRAAEQKIDLEADDLYLGPLAKEILAFVYAFVGEPEAAVEIFDRLLATSYYRAITVETLRLYPMLDPIRDDPRFQAMLEKHEQRTD